MSKEPNNAVTIIRKKNKPTVQLAGMDGNAFMIMGKVANALRGAGYSKEETDQYYHEATSGDYDNLLQVTMNWVDVK